jgi:hypothetical protein
LSVVRHFLSLCSQADMQRPPELYVESIKILTEELTCRVKQM